MLLKNIKHEADPTPSKSSSSSSSSSSKSSSSSSGSSKSSSSGTVVLVDPLVGVIFDVSSSEAAYWLNSGCVRLDDGGEFVFGNIINTSKYADKINIAAGSNVTVTNQKDRKIGTINTGDNSNTTVNNKGIIDTINTGKDSSLTLNNYEGGYIRNITGGNISNKDSQLGINVTNYGHIEHIQTGAYSTNEIFNYGKGYVDWLETGFGNASFHSDGFGNITGAGSDYNISKDKEAIDAYMVDIKKYIGKFGTFPQGKLDEIGEVLNKSKNIPGKLEYFIKELQATGKLTVTFNAEAKKYEVKNKGTGNPITISLDVSSGSIVYNGNTISLHSYLYDPAKDSGLSITTQAKLADLTTQWFQANEHDKKAILSIIRLVRIDINDKSLEQAIDNIVEKGIRNLIGGSILSEILVSDSTLESKIKDWDNARGIYLIGQVKNIADNAGSSGVKVKVGRWMSQAEYDAMIKSGKVQESFSGTTHVASPANPEAFGKQAKPGSLYVEFELPATALKATNEGWAKIVGPNSLEGRLAAKKGYSIPEMPEVENVKVKSIKK